MEISNSEKADGLVANISSFLEEDATYGSSFCDERNGHEITETEAFIDKKYKEVQVSLLSENVRRGIEKKITKKVKGEIDTLKISLERLKKNFAEKQAELITTVSYMKEEIGYLRNDIELKNNIIKHFLATESLVRDDGKSSHNDSKQLNKSDDFINNYSLPFSPRCINYNTPVGEETVKADEAVNRQLAEVRKNKHIIFMNTKSENNLQSKNTSHDETKNILVVGDSMLHGLDEKKMCAKGNTFKIRVFPGATILEMYDYLKPLLKKAKTYSSILLHVSTNDAKNFNSVTIVDSLLRLREHIKKLALNSKIVISYPILRTDDGKANLTIKKVCNQLKDLNIECISNNNFNTSDLGKRGLHLNKSGSIKLAKNIMNYYARI